MKQFLLKMVFFYPKIYSFFNYYRKHDWRREFEDRVAVCYKEDNAKDIKKIVKGISELRGVRKIMKYIIPYMDQQYINKFVDAEGIHYLDQAIKEGKGILLMAAHIGVPHLAFNALRVMGYDVTLLSGVTPKEPKRPSYRYYDTEDKTIFVHDLSLSKIYKKRILDTLKSGGIIYYDADAGAGRASEEVTFLGKTMKFPTGMIHYAHKANATIIPFMHFQRNGKTYLKFTEPVNNNWENKENEYGTIITQYVKLLESHVIEDPGQYLGIYGPTVLSFFYKDHRKI
jgi:Kdo2-lipid IVA lauroyltransferase/acyltransferase